MLLTSGFGVRVPVWVVPLAAPAVGLSSLGLLGNRYLALRGEVPDQLRPRPPTQHEWLRVPAVDARESSVGSRRIP